MFVSSALPPPPIAALVLWESVIRVGCSSSRRIGVGEKEKRREARKGC